jgi:hypothetical protein
VGSPVTGHGSEHTPNKSQFTSQDLKLLTCVSIHNPNCAVGLVGELEHALRQRWC